MSKEPQTREEIEAYLRAKLEADEAETGLYDLGLGLVVVDRVGHDNEISFQWFDEAISFDNLLRASGVTQQGMHHAQLPN